MNERILLAGCGDVGERVGRRLIAQGDAVWALRRHPPSHDDSGIQWLAADLTETASLRSLPVGITQMVYLPTPDRRDESAYRSVFVDGLRHVLEALDHHDLDQRALRRVVFVSSSAVYGDHQGDWVDESTPEQPYGFNGEVLLAAEQLLALQPMTSLTPIVLRLAGLYGPGRAQLFERLRAGKASVPRTSTHWANRIHSEDAAAAIVHLLQLPNPLPLYIGADDTPLPIDVLYDALAQMLDVAPPADGSPPAGIGSKRLSSARLRESGFVAQWPDSRMGYAALLAE